MKLKDKFVVADMPSAEYLSPLKFRCWNLIPNVTVFRGGAFGKWLGYECEASWMGSVAS